MSTILSEKQRTNLNTLTAVQKQNLARHTYSKKSYFENLFSTDSIENECIKQSMALRNEISRLLIERNLIPHEHPLEKLHEILSDEMKAYNFDDGVNKISTFFYDTDNQFLSVYYDFIKHVRQTFIKEPFWFQATPTIRIHCPNGLNNNHYPRYHTDVNYGHPPEEINIWLPLTEILDGHSFRCMTLEQSKNVLQQFDFDFSQFINSAINDKTFSNFCDTISHPVTTEFGNFLAFDSRCIHTGEPMKSHTRISMDIRILPLSEYEKMDIEYQGAGRRKILFTPGNCYLHKSSDEL